VAALTVTEIGGLTLTQIPGLSPHDIYVSLRLSGGLTTTQLQQFSAPQLNAYLGIPS